MRASFPLRLIIGAVIAIGAVILLLVLLTATDTALSVWERMRDLPWWLNVTYLGVVLVIAVGGGWLTWRVLAGGRSQPDRVVPARPRPSGEDVRRRTRRQANAGVDTSRVESELNQLEARQAGGQVFIAVFGEISTGKSSLIKALLPNARVETDPRGGTTQSVDYYHWKSPANDEIVLVDLPGFAQRGGAELGKLSHDEAVRAHLVIFVCDGDLDRLEHRNLLALKEYGKPIILAVNKSDGLRREDVVRIRNRLVEQVEHDTMIDVVVTQTGGEEEITRVTPDGETEIVVRPRTPRLDDMLSVLQKRLAQDGNMLTKLRDTAVFQLAQEELDNAVTAHRRDAAERLIETYARRAVIGALAAVTPGTDLVIQGALGTKLLTELCKLYEVPLRKVELDRFLELAGSRLRNLTSVTLAVAGNALKAFPGVGTIAGGAMHAVAYGMIFNSLGRAAAAALEDQGRLQPEAAAEKFEDQLRKHLESNAARYASLALKQRRPNKQQANG